MFPNGLSLLGPVQLYIPPCPHVAPISCSLFYRLIISVLFACICSISPEHSTLLALFMRLTSPRLPCSLQSELAFPLASSMLFNLPAVLA